MDKNLDISELMFDYLDAVACFTGNNDTNKSMRAIKKEKILNALFELEYNIHKILRQLNAYDSSSILIAESNWLKRNHFNKYMPSITSAKKVKIGQICTIDYGKTYKGEIGYIHPGLCVGKKSEKYLIIPMTSGSNWRNTCYHPVLNPKMTKEHRQSCKTEGFSKDGILLMNDAKFVSGGRILDIHEIIEDDIIADIQKQLLYIMFPSLYNQFTIVEEDNQKLLHRTENMENQIKNLKMKNEQLSEKLRYPRKQKSESQ